MRQLLSLVLISTMLARLASGAPDTDSVKAQISSMSSGAKIELRLKNNEKLRGTRGPVSDTGFTLVDGRNGERQIAFADVVSVKQVTSHTKRYVLIAVAIGVTAAVAAFVALIRSGYYS